MVLDMQMYVCVCVLKKSNFFLNVNIETVVVQMIAFIFETVIFILHVNTYLTRVVLSTLM